MTTLPLGLLRTLHKAPPDQAWRALFEWAWETCRPKMSIADAANETSRRDSVLAPADLFLATAGWDLWTQYHASAPRISERLAVWWRGRAQGRAVLILDGLSLREAPWVLHGATERGYAVHSAEASGAELPADTTPFAQALGFSQRSALENNGGGDTHVLPDARTDSVDLPWRECVDVIDASPDWVLWHHWPDTRLHALSTPGRGLTALAKEAAVALTSDDFWALVERLTTGRRLVVTGDHGYAASGLFPDTVDAEQAAHLKARFKSGRSASCDGSPSRWTPPIDVSLDSPRGPCAFVLGRRKWRSPGGYPTLTHGGLSLLEVAVPFLELSRPAGH